jgi:hypothetical protein
MATIKEKLKEASEKSQKNENGEYPEAWKPVDVGESLTGKITAIEAGRDEKTEDLKFVTVVDEDGKEWSVLETTVITKAMERLNKKVGDELGLEFRGEKENKKGKKYKLFVVV